MKMKPLPIILAVLGIVAIAAILWGPIVSQVEQAPYTVVENHGSMEIRDYAPNLVAETETTGNRKDAISEGFRRIAGYIFGDNTTNPKVAMTAPVIQQSSEKIAMTAPVTQQGNNGKWIVRFVMPAQYTLETLPKPNNIAVKLKKMKGNRFVVIRFSGMGSEDNLKSHTDELNQFISAKKLKPLSAPVYAFYNPPWTLPFLRRNEVMVEIAK